MDWSLKEDGGIILLVSDEMVPLSVDKEEEAVCWESEDQSFFIG